MDEKRTIDGVENIIVRFGARRAGHRTSCIINRRMIYNTNDSGERGDGKIKIEFKNFVGPRKQHLSWVQTPNVEHSMEKWIKKKMRWLRLCDDVMATICCIVGIIRSPIAIAFRSWNWTPSGRSINTWSRNNNYSLFINTTTDTDSVENLIERQEQSSLSFCFL